MRFFVEGERRSTGEAVAFEFDAASPSHAEAELVRQRIRWDRLDWVADQPDRPAQIVSRWAWYVLRWIAVVPAAFCGAFLLPVVMLFCATLGSWDIPSLWYMKLLGAGFVGWSFVLCVTYTAPHGRRLVCVGLALSVLLAGLGMTIANWYGTTWFEVLQRVVLILAAFGAINSVDDIGAGSTDNLPWKRPVRRTPIDTHRFRDAEDPDCSDDDDDWEDEDEEDDEDEDYGDVPDWPCSGARRVWVPNGCSPAFTAIAIPENLASLNCDLYTHYLVERLTWAVQREGWGMKALRSHAEEVVSHFGMTSELLFAEDIRDLIYRIVTSVPGRQALDNVGALREPMDIGRAGDDYVSSIEETNIDAWLIELEPVLRD